MAFEIAVTDYDLHLVDISSILTKMERQRYKEKAVSLFTCLLVYYRRRRRDIVSFRAVGRGRKIILYSYR
jgi:hypothetical protein